MSDTPNFVEFDVALNKADVEFLDQEATRLGCSRNDLLCRAVDIYLDRMGQLFKEWDKRRQGKEEASRTEHGAKKPPTAD
ncbi:MAG: hypothetical protein AB7O59_09680 [Pirellulales bacterium]